MSTRKVKPESSLYVFGIDGDLSMAYNTAEEALDEAENEMEIDDTINLYRLALVGEYRKVSKLEAV